MPNNPVNYTICLHDKKNKNKNQIFTLNFAKCTLTIGLTKSLNTN